MMSHSVSSDFIILEKLGKGAFGVVFKVKRKKDNKLYVLKQIDMKGLDSKQQQDALNEVSILASLDHPNITKYFDSFMKGSELNIVMELAEKGNLHDMLSQQRGTRLKENTIWKYFIQLCLAIRHIHSKKVLHRDLKSLNVFLSENDDVKLGDLGVAKLLTARRQMSNTFVGTPYYLSPELCESKPYNEKSDIWALGCILYEMCTLKHPFDAANQGILILKIIRGNFPPIPSSFSKGLQDLVSKLLCRNQIKRPTVDEIFSNKSFIKKAEQLSIEISVSGSKRREKRASPPPLTSKTNAQACCVM